MSEWQQLAKPIRDNFGWMVERLVALLDARGPPLRVDKCEDCQIVEATKGQGENFGYPAGTEPRWCPFCSQSHPGATWL